MALSPGSSNPQHHQGSPYPPGHSKLELTPTEVLDQIFGHLSQKYLQDLNDVQDVGMLETNRSANSNMRSLCLTSKRVDLVARPLLFQTIMVSSPAMLLRLYETLLASTQLGYHIRHIGFEILRENMGPWDVLPLLSPHTQSLFRGWDGEIDQRDHAVFNGHCCDQFLSSCYFEILRRTLRVHQLVIRIQPVRRRSILIPEGRSIGEMTIFMYQPFFRKVRHAVQASLAGDDSKFLHQLTTLELLGDPNARRNLFDITICESLLRIPTLTKITTFRDNGYWSALNTETSDPAKSGGALKNVRAADLQQSACLSHDFRAVGILLPALEVLRISSPRGECPVSISNQARKDQERGLGKDDAYLHEALTQMKNLHTLLLDFECDRRGDNEILARMNPILVSLPKLETIRIPLRMLVEDRRAVSPSRIDRLVDILPISLQRLTIKVDMCCQRYMHQPWPPSTTLLDFMEALTLLGRDAFPGLREVACCYITKVHRILSPNEEAEVLVGDFEASNLFDIEVDSYQRLESIQASLRQQNISFKVAYESWECHSCWPTWH